MKTSKFKAGAVGMALVASCVVALPMVAQADEAKVTVSAPASEKKASKQENIGVLTGVAVGAVAGGPIGAIVGAAAGAWIGDRYHKQEVAKKALASDLSESEAKRTELSQNVTDLSVSLADVRAKSEKLDLAFKNAD